MKEYLADTYFFIAYLSPTDKSHQDARALMAGIDGWLVTTTWILAEVADALCKPFFRPKLVGYFEFLEASSEVEILPSDDELFWAGFQLFKERQDKDWTLTDCISFVVMHRRRITDALTADKHFEQAGFNAVLRNQSH